MRTPNDPRSRWQLVADFADRLGGVIHRDQLRALGFSDTAIARAVETGHLHKVHPEVFTVGHRVLGIHGRRWGAVLTCGDGAVLSHRSGGALWEMAWEATRLHVSVPHRVGRAKRHGVVVHRPRTLRPEDVMTHPDTGLPVTTPTRTLFDIAATERDRAVERALEQLESRHLFDLKKIEALAARRLPGTRRVLRMLETTDPEELTATRSLLEERFLEMTRAHGFPPPLVDTPTPDGHRPDFHWPAHGVMVELDSVKHHLNRVAFERDRRQSNERQLAGTIALRFTYLQAKHEPGAIVRDVARALTRRARLLGVAA